MASNLFRAEAVEEQRTRLWGETRLSLPTSFAWLTAFLVTCAMALVTFAAMATYARKESGSGFLVPTLGLVKLMPPRPGTITAVSVAEGDLVAQGATLLTITAGQSTEGGQDVDTAMLDGLRQQRNQMRARLDLGRREAAVEAGRLEAAAAGLAIGIEALETARKIVLSRVEIAAKQTASIGQLAAEGIVTKVELNKRQDSHLSHLQEESNISLQIAAKQSELSQVQYALERLPIDAAGKSSQLEASVAELEAKLTEVEGHRAYSLSAPAAGRISALQAGVGKTAQPAMPLLSIVPEGDVLRAEMMIPARAIGFVTPGQPVRLRYDSFPYQQFGTAEGTVETVARTLLKPDELVGPIVLKEPSYRVTVALRRQSVSAYGKDVPLQADMQLTGDVVFDSRTLLAWLMDPLMSAWSKS